MNDRWIARIEWIAASLVSVVILFLILVRATHAGALWRDECGMVQLALTPRIGDILKNFQHQTLPPLFPLALRGYLHLFGSGNLSVHAIRLWVGAAFMGVVWFNCCGTDRRPSLILLVLFGLNSTFLFWGGYALIEVALILTVYLSARALLQPTNSAIIAAALAGILSVQLLINNLVLVLVLYFSAAAACVIRRSHRLAGTFAIIALVCLISALPYLQIYAGADWAIVLKEPNSFQSIWNDFYGALAHPAPIVPWIWAALFLVAIVGAGWQLSETWRTQSREPFILIFAASLSVLAPLSYLIAVHLAQRVTNPRHFLPLVALLAATLDVMVAELASINWIRLARLGVAFLVLLLIPFAVWPELIKRQTNIDIVAQKLEHEAGPGDLIVVNPSSLGISFNWYYRGAANWMTIPPIRDHHIHRYDLVKQRMQEADPLREVRFAIQETLRLGDRVWIVGGARPLEENLPLSLSPAPDPDFGWSARAYSNIWSLQLGDFLRKHVQSGGVVLSPENDVSETEKIPLLLAQGWRD